MENIQSNNALIDEFNDFKLQRAGFMPSEMNYISDWNNLMPVVEKINSETRHGRPEIRIGFRTEVFYSPLTKDGETVQKLSNSYPDGTIESVYKAVVQLLKWHNANK